MRLRHIVMALFTLCTLLVVAVPAGAQDVDLGNDGIDMNCEDFAEFNAVNGYFLQDGGSVERNVDNLDPNGDGIPCNEVPDDTGDDGPDLGNDGIDMNCDDFPERNAVEGYFAQDGGSAERNVDGLDPDGDGIPCNEAAYDGEDDGGADPGDVSDEPVTVVENAAPVTRLPQTGSGSTAGESNAGVLALAATLAALAAAMIANVRQRDPI